MAKLTAKDEFIQKIISGELKVDPQRARVQRFLYEHAHECDLYKMNFFIEAESYHGPVTRVDTSEIPGWPLWVVMKDESAFPANVQYSVPGVRFEHLEKGVVDMADEYEIWLARIQSMNALTGEIDN